MKLFNDPFYHICISLATFSKSETERYGSFLIDKNRFIYGMGFNRAIHHPKFHLQRVINMGYANHAEIEAMDQGIRLGASPDDCDIYVAGYFPKAHNGFNGKNRLLLKDDAWFTCDRCPPIMKKWGINKVYVPTLNGWQGLTIDESMECGKSFSKGKHEKRIAAVSTEYTIDVLAGKLFTKEELGVK